jgi:hypothetical protein
MFWCYDHLDAAPRIYEIASSVKQKVIAPIPLSLPQCPLRIKIKKEDNFIIPYFSKSDRGHCKNAPFMKNIRNLQESKLKRVGQ